MVTALRERLDFDAVTQLRQTPSATSIAQHRGVARIATIDWMRGLVMLLMVIDHASMAFDASHLSEDSAMYPEAATMALPAAEFFTRWITHLCAPTFVFLAGTALALSVERKVAKRANPWEIDKQILTRGAIIALLDPTIVSLGSGRWTFQVLLAIGLSMMCMAVLRRLSSPMMLAFGLAWFAVGEIVTGWVWHPPGASSIPAAFLVATYGTSSLVIKYPLLPWLAMMMFGWAFGRYMIRFGLGQSRHPPAAVLLVAGFGALLAFALVRYAAGYGDMFLHRADNSWQQWLHVSKYPPSITYTGLELGLLCVILAALMTFERRIGFRPNGILLVFGQTAMFFYLAHRLAFEIPATYFGLRGAGDLSTTYAVSIVAIVALYPACRWYRRFKAAHPASVLKYL
jgi:uncharacterized membrane protein